ncbi:MAG: helix-turn-helix domain-containing protein [Acetobacteraceae bacterium]
MNRVGPPRSRVDEIRAARGLSAANLADRASRNRSTVHKIVTGSRGLSEQFAGPLANVLGVRKGTLYEDVAAPIAWLSEADSAAASWVRPGEPPPDVARLRDVPVYGTAEAGADGAFHLNNGEAIDWARRPAGLIGVKGVFAIYTEGDSMVPWRRPGALVFVHANRAADQGCHVIAEIWERETGHPPRAFLKELVRRTATRVELAQYNPRKVIAFEKERVGRLYRVIEWEEALGV